MATPYEHDIMIAMSRLPGQTGAPYPTKPSHVYAARPRDLDDHPTRGADLKRAQILFCSLKQEGKQAQSKGTEKVRTRPGVSEEGTLFLGIETNHTCKPF
jgi:hypothetical protein